MAEPKTAMGAARFLSDESIRLAAKAAQLDDGKHDCKKHWPAPCYKEALIRRSEVVMDCAKLVKDWAEKS